MTIVPTLKISPKECYETDVGREKEEQTFTFNYVSYEQILNEIRKLQTATATQQNYIPTKILKENSEVFTRYFHKNMNFRIENSTFPSDLKVADVIQISEKKPKT